MSPRKLPSRFLSQFVETAASELGRETLSTVLEKAGLPSGWAVPNRSLSQADLDAAEMYASLQKAMRTYYGRGARGILIRMGSNLWKRLLEDSSLPLKAQSKIVFGLPMDARRKSALELLAKLISDRKGDVTVHTLDQDLLLADIASPGTLGQNEPEPVCYVTLGLVRECLHWATGQEHDIEESSCRAKGEGACEFKVNISNR